MMFLTMMEQSKVKRLRTKLVHPRGVFHSMESDFVETSEATREAIHELSLLNDGSVMALNEYSGNPSVVEEVYERRTDVYTYQVYEVGTRILVFVRFKANDSVQEFFSLQREHQLIIEYPAHITADGGLRITFVGEIGQLRDAIETLEEALDVIIERFSAYRPTNEQYVHLLTDRQRETLNTAVELGYYESPRQATHNDIAAKLDRSTGTVAVHLQKVEAHIMPEVISL
jgi:predicted DNA binding protein